MVIVNKLCAFKLKQMTFSNIHKQNGLASNELWHMDPALELIILAQYTAICELTKQFELQFFQVFSWPLTPELSPKPANDSYISHDILFSAATCILSSPQHIYMPMNLSCNSSDVM